MVVRRQVVVVVDVQANENYGCKAIATVLGQGQKS